MAEQEKLVKDCLDRGDKEAAINLLLNLAIRHAREKNFEAAEEMRSRIFDIDSMALSAIVSAGEAIEEEKHKCIDRAHLNRWARLYQELDTDEANALYFALKKKTCEEDETISRQGELKPCLYFIESGRIKVVYFENGSEVLLKTAEAGRLAGEDVFFCATLCTTSLITLARTTLAYLESDVLDVWRTSFPLLESKLLNFISKSERIPELLKAKTKDRRRLKRLIVGGKVMVQLMNLSGQKVGNPFKAQMGDLSRGGMCFYIRIVRKETANLMLAKRVHVIYLPPRTAPSNTIEKDGTVVAVRFQPFTDCAVSVKFDSLLPELLMRELEMLIPTPPELTI